MIWTKCANNVSAYVHLNTDDYTDKYSQCSYQSFGTGFTQVWGGILWGHYSFAVSVGSIHLSFVFAQLPACLCWQSLQQTMKWLLASDGSAVLHLFVSHMNHIIILEYTGHFSVYTDLRNNYATNAGQWYIHTHNYSPRVCHCHDQCWAHSGSPQLVGVEAISMLS